MDGQSHSLGQKPTRNIAKVPTGNGKDQRLVLILQLRIGIEIIK